MRACGRSDIILRKYVTTCSEPLLWICHSCGHSFHLDEWKHQGRQCPACQEKKGIWKCSLCLETFSQPTLQGERSCKRKKEHDKTGSAARARSGIHRWISAGIAFIAWLHNSRLGWGAILLFLGITAGGFGVYQFVQHGRSAGRQPDVQALPTISPVGGRNAGEAEYKRGVAYLRGEGVPINEQEAVRWFRLAAGKGDPRAQAFLGLSYNNGWGVQQNTKEAASWFAQAAEQGNALAQYNLGVFYANGKGVKKDAEEAARWYEKSAKQGNAQAQYNLGVCYEYGQGVPLNLEEAFKWYEKSATIGDAYAQKALGQCYDYGIGVTANVSEALRWYHKSAKQKHPPALHALGFLYETGRGVPKNTQQAVSWYTKAAGFGYEPAQEKLSSR